MPRDIQCYGTSTSGDASANLQLTVTFAARIALGFGVHPEHIADVLEDISAAIRTGDCAEPMYAITTDNF
jgi:hypothetical protein